MARPDADADAQSGHARLRSRRPEPSVTLPPFAVNPTEFAFPVAQSLFTFSRGHSAIDPDIRTPYVENWSVGDQREQWPDAAIEIRYVGNRGNNLWRSYDFNEVNIFENGFLQEFWPRSRTWRSTWRTGEPDSPTGDGRKGRAPDPRGRVRAARARRAHSPAAAASRAARSSRSCSRARPAEWRIRWR